MSKESVKTKILSGRSLTIQLNFTKELQKFHGERLKSIQAYISKNSEKQKNFLNAFCTFTVKFHKNP